MRTPNAIQRAHDLLGCFLMHNEEKETHNVSDKALLALHTSYETLCWVLEHENSEIFEENLKFLEETMAEAGYELVDAGTVIDPRKPN